MDLKQYQEKALKTAIYPQDTKMDAGVIYTALKLSGEAGEYAEKIGKIIRDKNGEPQLEDYQELAKELGDVLWYVAAASHELGFNLQDIAEINILKLESRAKRNKLQGEGDNR